MREENYCTMVATLVCKLLFVKKIVLYTQSPQYINNNQIIKQTFLKRIIKRLLVPQLSYTPVKVSDYTDDFSRMILTPKAFIPFVMYFKTDRLNRQYLKGDKINLLDVGKYRDYKNHFILLEALIHLPQQVLGMYSVTIVGQNSTPSEKDYYDRMSTFIDNKGLNGIVELRGPIHHSEMPELYLSNDVFILTSKREIASVSILEAMSYGLVCISTSHNGTTTYPGSNGFVFESENVESLTQVLNEVALLKGKLPFIGENTYKYACENYDASIYYSSLLELCSQS
jgi:glycosyltransferase involved in cell wall biosynthesis